MRPLAVLLVALATFTAFAQDYPQRPVRIVVPFAAGGNTDAIARIVGDRLTAVLGQQVVVDNRVGAGGAIAAEFVARAPADGHTLIMSAVTQMAILQHIQKITYDPQRDFTPVSIVGTNPFVLGVHESVPARTLAEFVEHAKARPGRLNYASGGNGSIGHLSAALFVARAGLAMTHVPYKGGGPAVADLVAGVVQMYFGNASELIQHSRSGKIRLLGVSSAERAPQLAEVPTIAETFPGFRTLTWNGLLAPAATPPAIVNRLAGEVRKLVREPAVAERLNKIGVDPLGSTPAEFAEAIRADIATWREAVNAAGIKPE